MKRSPPLARGKGLRRLTRLKPGGRLKPVNRKRKAAALARNFGDEADAVRAMDCLVFQSLTRIGDFGQRFRLACEQDLAGGSDCRGPTVVAHFVSRGASGGRFDIGPLCQAHHDEQHANGIMTFAERYGLDLRHEADRIALEHAAPLGLRGVAGRWAVENFTRDDPHHVALTDYEIDALLGWVRRRLARSPAGSAAATLGMEPHEVRGAMLLDLCVLPLSIVDLGALADTAGWPS